MPLDTYPLEHQIEDAQLTRKASLVERDYESADYWFNETKAMKSRLTWLRRTSWLTTRDR